MTATDTTYNGWANYETWCVNLWLSNDEGLYEQTNSLMRESIGDSVYSVARALKDQVEELAEMTCPGVIEGASFVADLFGAALSEADFDEIVTSWVDGMDDISIDDHELVDTTEGAE